MTHEQRGNIPYCLDGMVTEVLDDGSIVRKVGSVTAVFPPRGNLDDAERRSHIEIADARIQEGFERAVVAGERDRVITAFSS